MRHKTNNIVSAILANVNAKNAILERAKADRFNASGSIERVQRSGSEKRVSFFVVVMRSCFCAHFVLLYSFIFALIFLLQYVLLVSPLHAEDHRGRNSFSYTLFYKKDTINSRHNQLILSDSVHSIRSNQQVHHFASTPSNYNQTLYKNNKKMYFSFGTSEECESKNIKLIKLSSDEIDYILLAILLLVVSANLMLEGTDHFSKVARTKISRRERSTKRIFGGLHLREVCRDALAPILFFLALYCIAIAIEIHKGLKY